jgi:hypothetical protein
MPGPILHLGASVLCQHGGNAQPLAPYPRVLVSGQPVVTLATPHVVAGCSLASTSTPPCTAAQWVVGALRVTGADTPLAIATGSAVCTPTGGGLVAVAQQARVLAA